MGQLEQFAFSEAAGGWFICGWFANAAAPEDLDLRITARFSSAAVRACQYYATYRRSDLGHRGHAFVAFVPDEQGRAGEAIVALTVDFRQSTCLLAMPTDRGSLPAGHLERQLIDIMARPRAPRALRQLINRVAKGRPLGRAERHGYSAALRCWLLLYSLPNPPPQVDGDGLFEFDGGRVRTEWVAELDRGDAAQERLYLAVSQPAVEPGFRLLRYHPVPGDERWSIDADRRAGHRRTPLTRDAVLSLASAVPDERTRGALDELLASSAEADRGAPDKEQGGDPGGGPAPDAGPSIDLTLPALLNDSVFADIATGRPGTGSDEGALPPVAKIRADEDGRTVLGIAVDRMVFRDGILVIEGWTIGCEGAVTFSDQFDQAIGFEVTALQRPDVVAAYDVADPKLVRGFLAIARYYHEVRCVQVRVPTAPVDRLVLGIGEVSTQKAVGDLLDLHVLRLHLFCRVCLSARAWMKEIAQRLKPRPPSRAEALAHIERAVGVPGGGGMLVGWAVAVPPHQLYALAEDGTARSLDFASRWNRDDIVTAYGGEFGVFSANAGFILTLRAEIAVEGAVFVVALSEQGLALLAQAKWQVTTVDPVSFARWAFDFPTGSENFWERLAFNDGVLIDSLIRAKNQALRAVASKVTSFGHRENRARVSVVIPLYARFDFMQHQLLDFEDDPSMRDLAEIIYVCDDPRISDGALGLARHLSTTVDLPFKLVDGKVNRGYAGANNLGVRYANADVLLFLNSDVFPLAPGWLRRMLDVLLGDREIGIVGARLLNANLSLQHETMASEWNHSWKAYLNKHPRAGLAPLPPSDTPVPCDMVTGACLLIRKEDFLAIGGFDDKFLIGDFEDSDLCLKVTQSGRRIVSVTDVRLVHLERQSFVGIGTGAFRDKVARYNAFRHQNRWGDVIAGRRGEKVP